MSKRSENGEMGRFVSRALVVIALAAGAFLLWELRFVLVLLFGAVVVATILRAIAGPFVRWLHFPDSLAVLSSVVVVAVIRWTAGWKSMDFASRSRAGSTSCNPAAAQSFPEWAAC
jgi:predicted PurR-regulated permease PerM